MIVTDARVLRFVEEKIGKPIFPPFTVMGVEKDGRVVAGAVFNCFEPREEVEVTLAAERGAITRRFLRAMGEYVRDQLGCYRVCMSTEQPEVVLITKRLGGRVFGKKKLSTGKTRFLLSITKKNWKF